MSADSSVGLVQALDFRDECDALKNGGYLRRMEHQPLRNPGTEDCGKGGGHLGLAVQASRKALEMASLSAEEIDFIITGTNSPDMFFPCTSCFLQSKIGAKKAAGFDILAGCTSFIHTLSLADKFIKEDPRRKILVLCAEIMSKITDWKDRGTCVLFGDGAGALLLTGEEGDRGVLSTHLHSDGSLWELLYMPGGGSANPPSHETIDKNLHCIKMAGNQLFKVAVRALAEVSQEALEFNGLKSQDIEYMIPHPRPQTVAAPVTGLPVPYAKSRSESGERNQPTAPSSGPNLTALRLLFGR